MMKFKEEHFQLIYYFHCGPHAFFLQNKDLNFSFFHFTTKLFLLARIVDLDLEQRDEFFKEIFVISLLYYS